MVIKKEKVHYASGSGPTPVPELFRKYLSNNWQKWCREFKEKAERLPICVSEGNQPTSNYETNNHRYHPPGHINASFTFSTGFSIFYNDPILV